MKKIILIIFSSALLSCGIDTQAVKNEHIGAMFDVISSGDGAAVGNYNIDDSLMRGDLVLVRVQQFPDNEDKDPYFKQHPAFASYYYSNGEEISVSYEPTGKKEIGGTGHFIYNKMFILDMLKNDSPGAGHGLTGIIYVRHGLIGEALR